MSEGIISKNNCGVWIAYEKGYRIINNLLVNPVGKILKGGHDKDGYHFFSLVVDKIRFNVKAHKLTAFQKFGFNMFDEGLVVRHLDNNNQNNIESNIQIGTVKENNADRSPETIAMVALASGQSARKYTDEFIEIIKNDRINSGLSYSKLAKKYNLPTPSVAQLLINHNYLSVCPTKLNKIQNEEQFLH